MLDTSSNLLTSLIIINLTLEPKTYLSSMLPFCAVPPTSQIFKVTLLHLCKTNLLKKKSTPTVGKYCLEKSLLQYRLTKLLCNNEIIVVN